MPTSKLVIAHRGDHSAAHENTLEAMRAAIDLGVDMVEFDVRRCADGELIVHHGEQIGGELLANMSYPDALHSAAAFGYKIPRVEELLRLTAGRIGLDIEFKETGYEEAVLQTIADSSQRYDYVITSFNASTLSRVKSLVPGIRLGLLVEEMSFPDALKAFEKSSADFLGPDFALLDDAAFQQAAKLGLSLLPWTVDDPILIARYLRESCIAGVITNRPADALRLRSGQRL